MFVTCKAYISFVAQNLHKINLKWCSVALVECIVQAALTLVNLYILCTSVANNKTGLKASVYKKLMF